MKELAEKTIPKETKNNAIDMLIMLIVEELSVDLNREPDEMFSEFVTSKTVNCYTTKNPNYGGMGRLILLICIRKRQQKQWCTDEIEVCCNAAICHC